MSKPRRINLLKTEYFDILFASTSNDTAKILADNVDRLYKKAKSEIKNAHDLRIPIVISPDSDKFSVDYTSSPYNRILLFDGVPERDDVVFQDVLLGAVYHEIYLALSQSVRSPFNQFIYKTIGGDKYQPVSLIYLPFSFVEGQSFLAEGQNLEDETKTPEEIAKDYENGNYGIYGHFSDKYFLHILSLAKYENKFPNWLQASSVRDIYPGRELNEAAGSAFAAYLMQTYGIEKYVELWNQCGEVHFLLTKGHFKVVYGVPLSKLWSDFEDSIPLPAKLEEIESLEKNTNKLFPTDTEGLYSNLLLTDYGLVWYDSFRREVDIYDWNNKFKMRQMLFMASDVQKLTLSPDGRYLIISFWGITTREQFREDKTWIYDLQERCILDYNFLLRDGVICKLSNGKDVLAGIDVKDKYSKIKIYDFEYDDNDEEKIYEKDFLNNEYPNSLTYAGPGKINYIVTKNNQDFINQYNFESGKEKSWKITYKNDDINFRDLRLLTSSKDNKYFNGKNVYTFNYFPKDETGFLRMGYIILNNQFEPESVYFQNMDVAGGVKYPALYNDTLYYCSSNFSHNEIHSLPFSALSFTKGDIKEIVVEETKRAEPYKIHNNMLGEYELKKYFPLKYMIHCSILPFLAIKDLSVTEEQDLWPSLGGTIITQDDPFMNNRIMLSGSAGYATLDFKTIINPTVDEINDDKKIKVDDGKNVSFGLKIENTSTPVDINAGCLFKFNEEGEYNFTSNISTNWQLPIGMAFSKFKFTIFSSYVASTDYYDPNLTDYYPSLDGWPGFRDAYEIGRLALGAEYTNIHQYGISKFQERGFSVGVNFDSFWDIYEIRLLNEKYDSIKDYDSVVDLTKAQLKKLYNNDLLKISQLNIGLYGKLKIPRLTPLTMKNGFVLSLPTTIEADLFNKTGTAVHASVESLLLGYEAQNGFPFAYLFFSRIGLKFGYDLCLNYDTYDVSLPDLRNPESYWDVFTNVYVRDSIYLIYNMDFSASIGKLSECQLNLDLKTEYFIRSEGFAFTINFRVNF